MRKGQSAYPRHSKPYELEDAGGPEAFKEKIEIRLAMIAKEISELQYDLSFLTAERMNRRVGSKYTTERKLADIERAWNARKPLEQLYYEQQKLLVEYSLGRSIDDTGADHEDETDTSESEVKPEAANGAEQALPVSTDDEEKLAALPLPPDAPDEDVDQEAEEVLEDLKGLMRELMENSSMPAFKNTENDKRFDAIMDRFGELEGDADDFANSLVEAVSGYVTFVHPSDKRSISAALSRKLSRVIKETNGQLDVQSLLAIFDKITQEAVGYLEGNEDEDKYEALYSDIHVRFANLVSRLS